MDEAQAKVICAFAAAAFPRDLMPDSTVTVWSRALVQHEFADAQRAIEVAALSFDRMPSLRQIVQLTNAARRERLENADVPSLPDVDAVTLREFLDANPEVEQRLRSYGWLAGVFDQMLDDEAGA